MKKMACMGVLSLAIISCLLSHNVYAKSFTYTGGRTADKVLRIIEVSTGLRCSDRTDSDTCYVFGSTCWYTFSCFDSKNAEQVRVKVVFDDEKHTVKKIEVQNLHDVRGL